MFEGSLQTGAAENFRSCQWGGRVLHQRLTLFSRTCHRMKNLFFIFAPKNEFVGFRVFSLKKPKMAYIPPHFYFFYKSKWPSFSFSFIQFK
jgi:hypothetical protein